MVDINIDGQYQVNGVPIGGSSNPSVIDFSASNGTAVTGTTTLSISRSLLVPANAFAVNGMLEFMARYQKTGTAGAQSCSVYVNTSATLTGATQIAAITSGSPSTLIQCIRTARINSNTLTIWPNIAVITFDYNTNANLPNSVVFNTAVDNYLLFCIQLVNAADSSVVEMARAVKYLEV
jgi:hypothetical protein